MKIVNTFAIMASLVGAQSVYAADGQPLTGTVIGTEVSVDYATGAPSLEVNTVVNAFDGDFNTAFASYERSYTWAGLDLGEPHVITRVGWAPRNDGLGPGRVVLGVFQGANSPDFMDAVPIYVIEERGTIGQMSYADVECSRGFRYVRYVGPGDARCNIAELEFYGEPGEGDDSHLYQVTNLPTVIINTENAVEPYDKEHNITSLITIISDNGTKILSEPGTSRLRGNASMQFPKKPYRIKFDKKQRVLDAPAKAKKWTLINNYGDKTLMRNIIAFEAARRAGMEYVPYCTPVDVILNGEYKGGYQLCDQVEVADNRVPVTEMETTDTEGDALTGGYFIEVDGYADQELSWFMSPNRIPVTIKSPDEEEITPEQTAYISDYFGQLDRLVFGARYDGEDSYRTMLDIDSFLRHFIVGEFSGNTDTYWSTYMYKHRGDPLFYTGPVWDFDLAFDNDSRIYPVNDKYDYIYMSGSSAGTMKNFVNRIISGDPATAEELSHIWSDMRNTRGFTAENFTDFIDRTADEMDASLRLNFMRWPIVNQWVHMNPKVYNSYGDAIADVRDFVTRRIEWLDNKIGYDPGYTAVTAVVADANIVRFAVADGHVVITDGTCSSYRVYDLTGRCVARGTASMPAALDARGLYIVQPDNAPASRIIY